MDKYLICREYGNHAVVVQDLGRTENALESAPPGERVRVFAVEPGNNSCGSHYQVVSERADGTFYTVAPDGEVVGLELVDELPEYQDD